MEITRGILPSFNKKLWHYHTPYAIDGYHTTTVELHLHVRCKEAIEKGEKQPKPIDEVISISFIDHDRGYERED